MCFSRVPQPTCSWKSWQPGTCQLGNPSSVLKFSIIAFSKIDTPGFGDVVDNTNCWQPITGEQSQVGNQSQVNLIQFTFFWDNDRWIWHFGFFYFFLVDSSTSVCLLRVQLRSTFRLLGGTVLSIPGRRNEVREIIWKFERESVFKRSPSDIIILGYELLRT